MIETQHSYAPLLAALPYPAIVLNDRTVQLFNAPAASLLPDIREGATLSSLSLPSIQPGDCGVATCSGKLYTLRMSAVDPGAALLTFLPGDEQDELLHPERWNALVEQLRGHLSDLFAAVQVLSPTVASLEQDRASRSMALLQRSLYRLLRLTRHMELARTPGLDYTPAVFDLAGFCSDFSAGAAPLLKVAEVELQYRSSVSLLPVYGDEKLLQFLLLTLLSNAVKAVGTGGTVSMALTRSGGQAMLRISNTGSPMDGAALASLFQPEAAPAPHPGGGLGLGLALARQVVALHGGALMAQGNEAGGLTLALSLPQAPPDAPLTVSSPGPDREGGFSPLLVELSDALPVTAFTPLDLE